MGLERERKKIDLCSLYFFPRFFVLLFFFIAAFAPRPRPLLHRALFFPFTPCTSRRGTAARRPSTLTRSRRGSRSSRTGSRPSSATRCVECFFFFRNAIFSMLFFSSSSSTAMTKEPAYAFLRGAATSKLAHPPQKTSFCCLLLSACEEKNFRIYFSARFWSRTSSFFPFLFLTTAFNRNESNDNDVENKKTQVLVAQKVATGVYKGVTTTELDELAAETAASMTATHPDYAVVRFIRESIGFGALRAKNDKEGERKENDVEFLVFFAHAAAADDKKTTPSLQKKHNAHPARCSHRRLQPAQEHAQVIQRDVSIWREK